MHTCAAYPSLTSKVSLQRHGRHFFRFTRYQVRHSGLIDLMGQMTAQVDNTTHRLPHHSGAHLHNYSSTQASCEKLCRGLCQPLCFETRAYTCTLRKMMGRGGSIMRSLLSNTKQGSESLVAPKKVLVAHLPLGKPHYQPRCCDQYAIPRLVREPLYRK